MTSWWGLSGEDERLVGGFMSKVATLPVPDSGPEVSAIWFKAQLLRRWDAERRAQLPLDVIERVEIVAGLATAVLLLVWALPSLTRVVTGTLLGGLG
jgi:hypothetical protein